mmetsp:Transcript_978/g.1720  ORF Transcript_978/g.1720 Transcript_978/m.1720 type:complete len:141 (-) Transcript_978:3706-4128(-)
MNRILEQTNIGDLVKTQFHLKPRLSTMISSFKALCIFLCICVFIITTTTNFVLPLNGSTENIGMQSIANGTNAITGNIAFDEKFFSLNVHDFDEPGVAAPWIPKTQKKVLFVELHKWKDYYGPSKYKTGEYYVSATWDYA